MKYLLQLFFLFCLLQACQSEPLLTPEHLANLKVGDNLKEASLLAFAKKYAPSTKLPVFDTAGSYKIEGIPNDATKKSLIFIFTESPPSSIERNKETFYFSDRISIQHVQGFEHEQKDTWKIGIQIFKIRHTMQMRLQVFQTAQLLKTYFLIKQPNQVWIIETVNNDKYFNSINRK
jgi:hypothetical protein